MTSARSFALFIAVVGSCRAISAADVIAAPLDADAIAQMQSLLGGRRAAPGDVMLANSSFQVVVFAQAEKSNPGRVGRILFLSPTASEETFMFESGPINDWERGDLGRADQLAVVRFQRQSKDWSAELVVQMPEKTSWLEVTTTIRNTGPNTLEIPMVDVVRGPSVSRLADDKGMIAIGKVDAPTLVVLRPNGGVTASPSAKGEWFLGNPSSDGRGNPVARAGKRLFSWGKNDAATPVQADESWSGDLKDRKTWHRIPAGATRTVHRRLVFGQTGASIRPMLASASRTPSPTLHFVPAGKNASPKNSSLAERAKAFVGRTPPATQQPQQPVATPVPTSTPSTTMVAGPTPLQPKAVLTPKPADPPSITAKVKPVDDIPKVINESIDQIGDLPPPIK
jgi:hypothetical protein